jgi:copper homeostasis protein
MLLEVIVQTVADARAAEAGGANRLEVVREIDRDGLSPSLDLVRAIASETSLPLRVMVRESDGFLVSGARELATLQRTIAAFATVPVDGAVVGFAKRDELDLDTTRAVIAAAPSLHVTFHRAFDVEREPAIAIDKLQALPRVDRVLTGGGNGNWADRCRRLEHYAAHAGNRLKILVGGGVDDDALRTIASNGAIREVHVGRAARDPRVRSAPVSPDRVRQLREIADRYSRSR